MGIANTANVLIVDDQLRVAQFMLEILAQRGIRAHIAEDTKKALHFLERNACDLAFIGLAALGNSNIFKSLNPELVQLIRTNQPEMPIVPMAGAAELSAWAQHMRHQEKDEHLEFRTAAGIVKEAGRVGYNGFLVKPLYKREVEHILDTFLPNQTVASIAGAQQGSQSLFTIVGKSSPMMHVTELAERIAPTSAPVLISGESGTGKELFAYLIHHRSKRSLGPYIRLNCAALSDSLLESELFGHEKGAFTGAYAQRKGRFESAHGGTLLLDEITETPIRFQAKLLRILEEQEFERVGGNENVKVSVRIISTTNKDLLEEVQKGRFRQDLYYRLSATRLVIPPLRERREDLTELVWYFVNQYVRESQRCITKLDPIMMEIFANYDWPGNIRQLRNVVRTSLILGVGATLSVADVSWLFDGVPQTTQIATRCDHSSLNESWLGGDDQADSLSCERSGLGGISLEVIERRAILDTLRQTAGNRKKAAEVLGISDRTLRERIRRYKEQDNLVTA
jgi:DNA-binding NtrC family response regulator